VPERCATESAGTGILGHVPGQRSPWSSVADRWTASGPALRCLGVRRRANEKLEDLGLLIKAPNTGLPLQSPYLPVLNRQTEIARKLAAELALPPAQRNRVGPYDADAGPSVWDALEG
jgi:hypothetical protein